MPKINLLTPKEVSEAIHKVAKGIRWDGYGGEGQFERAIKDEIRSAFEGLAWQFEYMDMEDNEDDD